MTHTPPTWFLDIDGVINALRPTPVDLYNGDFRQGNASIQGVMRMPLWCRPAVIEFVNGVSRSGLAKIVWCTTWREHASTKFAPVVGLDGFDVIEDLDGGGYHPSEPAWWKVNAVRNHIDTHGVQRFVWTDDDLGPDAVRNLNREGGFYVAPRSSFGLDDDNFERILTFLEEER